MNQLSVYFHKSLYREVVDLIAFEPSPSGNTSGALLKFLPGVNFSTERLYCGFGMSSQTIEMNNESGESGKPAGIESDLLDPYERLVSIEVLGKRVEVPENNRLLRCFQYLSLKTISYGDFCWNGECTNCQVWYHVEGQTEDLDRPALACRIEVAERMVITKLSHFIELDGISK